MDDYSTNPNQTQIFDSELFIVQESVTQTIINKENPNNKLRKPHIKIGFVKIEMHYTENMDKFILKQTFSANFTHTRLQQPHHTHTYQSNKQVGLPCQFLLTASCLPRLHSFDGTMDPWRLSADRAMTTMTMTTTRTTKTTPCSLLLMLRRWIFCVCVENVNVHKSVRRVKNTVRTGGTGTR
jgi:hypothetical protein